MKGYTDLEQSKKLAEILPLESADMYWWSTSLRYYIEAIDDGDFNEEEGHIRAWSLAALLDILPDDWWGYNKHYFLEISKMGDSGKPYVRYFRFREDWEGANFGRITHISYTSDSLVDACYEMILKLHELNLL